MGRNRSSYAAYGYRLKDDEHDVQPGVAAGRDMVEHCPQRGVAQVTKYWILGTHRIQHFQDWLEKHDARSRLVAAGT